ncbi:Wadjet anti-phage system protein JetD domain-containing protein [Micromonospora sp. NPDC006766]|uniref:Wadjet anti-phage system protein JetD domain-containing protein n=1 Tax=Micromonospora sp. NPDC006766 TaxID=3154778 RepID=UPI00340BE743
MPRSRSSQRASWATVEDVIAVLRRRWERGDFLRDVAHGTSPTPLAVLLKGPTAAETADNFGDVQQWATRWREVDGRSLRVEYRSVGGRLIGTNQLPHKAWIDTPDGLWRTLGVQAQVDRYQTLLDLTRAVSPPIAAWAAERPMKLLTHEQDWTRLLDTVAWIDHHADPATYLRQIDARDVDTKFVETRRSILAELLDRHLPADRVNVAHPPSAFAERYGLRPKPLLVRMRFLDNHHRPMPYSDLTVRASELATTPPPVATVYVVENETTFLAFPPVHGAAVILGSGYAVAKLEPLTWLRDRNLIYWGDIDTHGFAILDRLRAAFSHTRSILMDRETLLAHRAHWGREPAPTRRSLPQLTEQERALVDDLVNDTFAPSLRLEQEHIRYPAISDALKTSAD